MLIVIRSVIVLMVICAAFLSAAAQSNKGIEAEFLRHLNNIEKWSNYGSTSDDGALKKENEILKQKILKYGRKSSTLRYEFKALAGKMYIATSKDRKFRIYSWDTEGGGTAHFFESVFQYLGGNGKANIWTPKSSEGDACPPFYDQVFQTNTSDGPIYLANSTSICSTSLAAQGLSVFRIDLQKLISDAKLIRTKAGLTNSISFEYDFFSVVNHPERPIKLFFYDEANRSFRFPVVIDDTETPQGRVTDKFITYRFNGKHFVKVG